MKKSSRFLTVFLLLAAVALTACGGAKPTDSGKQPAAASGDGSLDRVKKAGKLVVAVDTTYPPMEYVDGNKIVGYDVDLAKAIGKKMGVEVEFQSVDWDGILTGLLGKRYDVIISSMNITPERSEKVNFVEYAKMSQVFVSKKGTDVKAEKDLSGKVVVVQADTTSHEWVEKLKAEKIKDIKEIRSFKGATDAFLEVKNGRGDVIVIDEPVGLYYAKKDAATFAVTGRAMDAEPIGVAIRKEDNDLKAAIDKAVQDLRADGTYSKIATEWFGGELGK
ncbi:MAG TPA: ABC transporter substrate-binding protein [Symbiobacteriaceae bacterium]|nr:ABC transporter substrate-binding protein [Symbiobacteriaceae bacterium]